MHHFFDSARREARRLGQSPWDLAMVTWVPLLAAVLMLCVSLVHRAATTLGMWRRSGQRDWHTQSETSALPQTKPDIYIKDPIGPPGSRPADRRKLMR